MDKDVGEKDSPNETDSDSAESLQLLLTRIHQHENLFMKRRSIHQLAHAYHRASPRRKVKSVLVGEPVPPCSPLVF